MKERNYPSVEQWRNFLKIFLLAVGTAFFISGVFFFFAYNWQHLHRFVKLSIVAGLLVSSGIALLVLKISDTVRDIITAAAFVLTGLLFTLFGQIYQTGADAYDLFFTWTLAALPMVIWSSSLVVWLLWIIVFNVTGILFAGQISGDWWHAPVLAGLGLLDISGAAIFEFVFVKKKITRQSRWFRFVLVFAGAALILVWVIHRIWDSTLIGDAGIYSMVSLSVSSLIFYAAYRHVKDLGLVAMSLLHAFIILFFLYTRIIGVSSFEEGAIFAGILLFIVLTVACVYLLVRIRKKWDSQGESHE